MRETKYVKPLMRSCIHIVEHRNMQLQADNGILVGISYPKPPGGSDEGGFFIHVARPGALKGKNLEEFADRLDTMMTNWLEENAGKIAALAKKCSDKKR